ncbi:MAG: NAD(P)/FAD-dependent oxidoreductase [Acidobacteria bacterium]|nr:NAD(P)/FAD-dependent oxidoreductase [Acidobacteriota bacterium]
MARSHTIVILGGGIGGVATARSLRKRLPGTHRIILVDRQRDHVFAPSLLWLMVGQRTADAITRPLTRLERQGIEVRIGTVQHVDPDQRVVMVDGEAVTGDYLVITLGAELAPELIPGLAEAGHNFYSLAGAQSLWTALQHGERGRIVVLTAAPAYKCPAAPYEAAMLLDAWYRTRGLRDGMQFDVYAAEPAPMGVAGPHVSSAVTQLLASKEIAYHPEHQVVSVDPARKRLTFSNGTEAVFDVLAYVPPHRAPAALRDSGLLAESGWIAVDRHTMQTRWRNVYAIGDVVSIPLALGKPLPKAGVFAHAEADVVAENVAHAIAGENQPARFDGHGECFIEIGGGKAGFGGGDFYAEPKPAVMLRQPSWRWHLGKVWVEKSWLYRNF